MKLTACCIFTTICSGGCEQKKVSLKPEEVLEDTIEKLIMKAFKAVPASLFDVSVCNYREPGNREDNKKKIIKVRYKKQGMVVCERRERQSSSPISPLAVEGCGKMEEAAIQDHNRGR